ncbi:MAG: hypothetical protein A3F12_06405 [Gammaproteobacteria bacterium RIFCSPHIGHO2_12_FULL_38_14]|nr:MAG: hypothetical protein A3F12_06405 [Gammaproteobacteria bacterium RIFCSPHIGHO2_12_FULL_38_14]
METRQFDSNDINAEEQTRRIPKISVHFDKKNKLGTLEAIKDLLNKKDTLFDYFRKFCQLLEENPSIIDDHHAEIRGDTQQIGNSSSVKRRRSLGVKTFLSLILMNENIADVDVSHFEFLFDEETITLSIHSKEKINRDRIDDLFRKIRFVNFLHIECRFSLVDIFTLIKDAVMSDSAQSIIEAVKSKIAIMYEDNNLSEEINRYFSKQVAYKKIPSDLIQESDNAPSDLANDQESSIESRRKPKKRKLISEQDQQVKYIRNEQSVEANQPVLITDDEQAALNKLYKNVADELGPGRITALSEQELDYLLNNVAPALLSDDQNLTSNHDADEVDGSIQQKIYTEKRGLRPSSREKALLFFKKIPHTQEEFLGKFCFVTESNPTIIDDQHAEMIVTNIGGSGSQRRKYFSAVCALLSLLKQESDDYSFDMVQVNASIVVRFNLEAYDQEKRDDFFRRIKFIQFLKSLFDHQPTGLNRNRRNGLSYGEILAVIKQAFDKKQDIVTALKSDILEKPLSDDFRQQIEKYFSKPVIYQSVPSHLSEEMQKQDAMPDVHDDPLVENSTSASDQEMLHGFQFDSRGYRRNSLVHRGFGNSEKNPAENQNISPLNDFDEDALNIGSSMQKNTSVRK